VEKHLEKVCIVFLDLGDKNVHQQIAWANDVTGLFVQKLND
jgi:hypothetical protein